MTSFTSVTRFLALSNGCMFSRQSRRLLVFLRALIGSSRCLFSLWLAKGDDSNARSTRHMDRLVILSKNQTRNRLKRLHSCGGFFSPDSVTIWTINSTEEQFFDKGSWQTRYTSTKARPKNKLESSVALKTLQCAGLSNCPSSIGQFHTRLRLKM